MLLEYESFTVVAPFLLNRLYLKDTEPDVYILAPEISLDLAEKIAKTCFSGSNINVLPQAE